jgi:peptidoglycan/LPS O-acetylase OafA/YrhL
VTGTSPDTVDVAPAKVYTGALDGLRGYAAIIVVMVHARVAWMQGGTAIISTFFPLSGFLITRNLLREIDRSRTVDFSRFWSRRVRRLLPASAIGVAVATAAEAYKGLRPRAIDTISSLTGWKNWQMIYSPNIADPAMSVWWSLAIEEQYYLVYPSVLLLLMLLARRRGAIAALWLIAASSFVYVLWGYHTRNPTIIHEVYHGTHGRIWEILAGCLLALHGKLPDRLRVGPLWSFALIVVCQTSLLLHHDVWFEPPLRILLTIIGTVWLIDGVCHGAPTRTGRFLGSWPLRPLGLISYEIYMLHTSVLLLLPHLGGIRLLTVSGAFLLSVAVAWVVHLLVSPLRAN